ncbi:mobility group HMGI-C isoform X2 [Octopus vulgaris]|uniref:Mobility group HMGI-C isoform X2 n=1 Tax=Octopus vulgaris TaxID=6645 RepID=A0AA36AVL3_OCTVU|nr:mobility group HMGI-C isoform X2 [Octopus vulgaris]
MSSRNAKRGRKDPPNSEIVAKEMKPEAESNDATDNNTEVKVKKSPGRPRKPESEKKKWVPTGRSRGRPRIHPVDHNKVKKPRGRPRIKPMVHKEKRPRGRPRKNADMVKKSRGRPQQAEKGNWAWKEETRKAQERIRSL